MHMRSVPPSVARTVRSLIWPALTALGILALSATTTQAQAGTADFRFEDGPLTLTSGHAVIVSGPGTNQTAVTVAKAIITNSSSGVRSVECKLTHNTSVDIAAVTLPANSHATISVHVAKPATNRSGGHAPFLECKVTSSTTTLVTAQWAKLTTWFLSGVTIGPG